LARPFLSTGSVYAQTEPIESVRKAIPIIVFNFFIFPGCNSFVIIDIAKVGEALKLINGDSTLFNG